MVFQLRSFFLISEAQNFLKVFICVANNILERKDRALCVLFLSNSGIVKSSQKKFLILKLVVYQNCVVMVIFIQMEKSKNAERKNTASLCFFNLASQSK